MNKYLATSFACMAILATSTQAQDIDIDSIVANAIGTIDAISKATEKLSPAEAEKLEQEAVAANPPPTEKEMKNDAGVQAVIQMQDAKVPDAPNGKVVSATDQVKAVLAKNKIEIGRSKERYVNVADTSIPMTDDPANDKDFFVKRDAMILKLLLKMKQDVGVGIGTKYSAEEQLEIFGTTNTVTSTKSGKAGQWPLFGVTVLAQAESWDGKEYHMAIASVWSKALHQAAKATLLGEDVPGTAGKKTMKQWLDDTDLALVCGPRQFVDPDGTRVFLGIAAREIGVNAVRDEVNKETAKMSALSSLVFSLYSDVEFYAAHQANMTLYELEDGTAASKASEKTDERISQRVDNRMVEGAYEIESKEIVHPLSGKKVYVSVYALDTKSAAKSRVMAEELIATRVATELANKRALGRNQGYRDQVNAAKANTSEFQKGREEGNKAIQDKLDNTPKGRTVNEIPSDSVTKDAPKSQQGIFTGDSDIPNDF